MISTTSKLLEVDEDMGTTCIPTTNIESNLEVIYRALRESPAACVSSWRNPQEFAANWVR
jgi:hypothetical protein